MHRGNFALTILCRGACVALFAGLLLAPPAEAQDTLQPGATNPLGAYLPAPLLRDDELFYLNLPKDGQEPAPDKVAYITYQLGADKSLETQVSYTNDSNWTTESHQAFTARGRPFQPYSDNVVVAQRSGDDVLLRYMYFPTYKDHNESDYTLAATLGDRLADSTDFMDVAIGDLDSVPDSSGAFHDEVVVAWADQDYVLNISVLDYGMPNADPTRPVTVTTERRPDTSISVNAWTDGRVQAQDNAISVAIGDLDGDGIQEINVAVLTDSENIVLEAYDYVTAEAGNKRVELVADWDYLFHVAAVGDPATIGTVDLAAGNFDGDADERAELVVATSVQSGPGGLTLTAFALDEGKLLTKKGSSDMSQLGGKVALSPGLFVVDPENGYPTSRRGLLLAHDNACGGVEAWIVDVAADLGSFSSRGYTNLPCGQVGARWAATAGALQGITSATASQLTWWASIMTWDQEDGDLTLWTWDGANDPVENFSHVPVMPFDPEFRPALATFDIDGDSLIIGPPTHIVAEGLLRTDYLLQEPPKHTYWDQVNGVVENLTRLDTFNITLKDTQGNTISQTQQHTSGGNIGLSGSGTLFATLDEGKPWGLVEANVDEKAHIQAAIGGAFEGAETHLNTQYTSDSVTKTGDTSASDYASGTMQQVDIWRYPIYGTAFTEPTTGTPAYGYYDLMVPWTTATTSFDGDPLNFDWYQPLHENGNVLSYPERLNADPNSAPFTPADLGTVTIGGQSVPGMLYKATKEFTDDTSGSIELDISDTFTTGDDTTYNESLTGSLDIAGSFYAKEKFFVEKVGAAVHGKITLQGGGAWSQTANTSKSTAFSTGITLSRPDFNSEDDYAFYPTFYITADGTLKVAHAADELAGEGKNWWKSTYGQSPDAALNLPERFEPLYDNTTGLLLNWEVNEADTRKQMRGITLTDPEATWNSYFAPVLYNVIQAGDTVRIAANVYNYDTSDSFDIASLDVRFDYVEYDSCSGGEVGTRTAITTTQVTLPAQGVAQAVALWDTSALALPEPGTSQQYRIYVVLDPDNKISNETYETEPAGCTFDPDGQPPCNPGQNNEGWWLTTVYTPPEDGQVAVPDISLGADSFAALAQDVKHPLQGCPSGNFQSSSLASTQQGEGLVTGRFTSALNDTVQLRVSVHADRPQPRGMWLLIYDGEPGVGETIAMKHVQGIDAGRDRHVWVDWRPKSEGEHDLHAVVVEPVEDPQPGNNVAQLRVEVTAPHTSPNTVYLPWAQQTR